MDKGYLNPVVQGTVGSHYLHPPDSVAPKPEPKYADISEHSSDNENRHQISTTKESTIELDYGEISDSVKKQNLILMSMLRNQQ